MRSAIAAIVLLLLMGHTISTATATAAPATAAFSHVIPLGPLRQDWPARGGYCGEMSIQQTALYHGAWVGQEQARKLGGGELLLGSNLEGVVEKLGFQSAAWKSNFRKSGGTVVPSAELQRFMVWVKTQVLRNFTAIFAARIKGGTDEEYDHIMPVFGVYLHAAPGAGGSSSVYDPLDELVWGNDYGQQIRRAMGTPGFYAPYLKCTFTDSQGGCIASDTDAYGLAMGPLRNAYGLLRPLRMVVTGWSDRSAALAEPLVSKRATGNYTLDLRDSGLAAGQTFTMFRCEGAGSVPRDPKTIADLRRAPRCTASAPLTMRAGLVLTQALMGPIKSDSVVYFVCVAGS